MISQLRREHKTILLTTHYIEEAERLCDRVAIVDEGRIVAMGTPAEIQAHVLGHSLIEIRAEAPLPDVNGVVWRDAVSVEVAADRLGLTVKTSHPAATLIDLVKWIDQQSVELADVHLRRPSLEDAFIALTGKSLRE